MRKTFILSLALAACATPAMAQDAPAQESQQVDPADAVRAAKIFNMFGNLIRNEDVQQPAKTRLLACMYNNPLRRISLATGRAIENNAALSDERNRDILVTAAQICGVRFGQDGAAAPSGQSR